ncbi:uncharacterized protein LOC132614625 [Lycium barbarum]|uniref:uncharacterized protein LOC132614625 n=1 Tax=Lycium barbarum TaxID=112863 RepID=UPI00293F00FB|nr:uncharacterized protein LOC132614625 [Lycium barbarum]
MINEKLSNSEVSNEQPRRFVAWEGDVYSQVLGNEKTGYVRGLGLGSTPSVLWGSRSSFGNTVEEDSSNEVVKRLEQEVTKLKDINGTQNEEMSLVKQNQEKLLYELAWVRKPLSRNGPNELPIHHNINGISDDQFPMPTVAMSDYNNHHRCALEEIMLLKNFHLLTVIYDVRIESGRFNIMQRCETIGGCI